AAGMDAAGLCNPGEDFLINLTIGLETNIGQPTVYRPACTLTELGENWQSAYSDPEFGDFVQLQFEPTANPLGISLEAQDLTLAAKLQAEEDAEKQRQEDGGFKATTESVSKTILTPASVIQEDLAGTKQNVAWYSLQSTDNPVVEALNIFTSTLISKLLERAQKGLANLSSGSELSGLLGGEFSGTISGRSAAEAVFSELRQPIFGSSGSFDVLSELTACPGEEELRDTNNCAIGAALQTAIQDGWTVQEFIDYQTEIGQSFTVANSEINSVTTQQIQNSEGISETGITILKKYRVVPVGWQVASDYIQSTADTPTLKDLVDCYNYCGTADTERNCSFLLVDEDGNTTDYSPYCRLVDPYWVLKAPQNFCEREAPGGTIVEAENFDTDANTNTQESVVLSRMNYCADARGCIEEEQEGVCTAYGYCTEEERIYRFDGEICEEEYSSCETFTDDNGDPVSLVKTTLNYNDCATDPDCQWYCKSQNEAGQFDCAGPTETYVSCSEDVTDNESDYGLSYDVSLDTNEACACTSTQTCQVPAGSTTGDGDGNGLIDYRECAVSNTDGSQSVCSLDDNCGASNSTYSSATGTCTCTVTNSGDVDLGSSSVDITVEDDSGADATQTCTLDDEDGDSSADSCTSDYSTYSSAPVCSVASAGLMNCGDVCYTDETGGTCTNSLGNTCTDGDATDSDSDDRECLLSDSCSVSSGLYSCTSSDGNVCILGTITEEPATVSDTIYFDRNVETCDSNDAGCTQYIRIKPDTNLIPNALFDYYDADSNTINDSDGDGVLDATIDGDDLAFCTHDGSGCATDTNCIEDLNSDGDGLDADETEGQCIGWIQNTVTAYVLDGDFDSLLTPDVGNNFIQLEAGSSVGTLEMTVDTGHSLANRTFTFAYRGMTTGTCSDVSFTIGNGDGTDVSSAVTADSAGTDYEYTSDWADYTTTYTFADATTDEDITVAISASTSCNINIGATSLVEDDEFTDNYTNYAINNLTYLNGDTVSCEPEDVGCELYVEEGASEEDGIPGLITNPDSDDCVDASGNYNYDNPSCNQCNGDPEQDQDDDYYEGCDFYQEVPLDSTVPLTSDPLPGWLVSGTDAYEGTIKRLGGYCEGDSTTHCYEDTECSSGSCIAQLSIVPSSGGSCSVSAVGCEEYTNLAAVEEGGEGLQYFTELKQCVRRDDQETAVFYTFEGSDTAGVQVQDHTLKVDTTTNAPCTHLDLQSEEFNADCVDSTDYTAAEQLEWDCGPDGDIDGDGNLNGTTDDTTANTDTTTDDEEYGTDADCRQYVTADGDIFYRYASQVIEASDDCTPLRNSTDTRVYFALPEASNDCSAEEVSCREYKGTDSGSEETIIDEDFSNNSTEDWSGATSTSNESVLQSGYSLQLHDDDTANATDDEISYELFTTEDTETLGLLEDGDSYVLTFWAKADDGGTLLASLDYETTAGSNYYFTTDGSSTTSSTITLDPNNEDGWQFYAVGPVILPNGTNLDDGDEYFKLQYTGTAGTSEAYIDTVVLSQSNSQYIIQDSARACNNFEGCRLYEDRDNNDHYLKSFKRLCEDSAVGCEAMLATQQSANPFTEAYNLDNEYDQDDVIVQYDQPVTLVYNEDNECSSTVMGCTEFGLADVDDRTGEIIDYESEYLLDLPDSYSSTLCEQPQLSCREYTSEYDGTVYFKDPGEKLCELKEYTTSSNTFTGWFKLDTTASEPDCPLQYDFFGYGENYASQPLGGVCNSNSVHHDTDGTALDEKVGTLCSQDADCYPEDWDESIDGRPRCISSIDDDVDLYDDGVHQYVDYTDDGVSLSNVLTDFGWAGACPDDQSGCSEYMDPYSPNIVEENSNWSFEYDVLDDDNVQYASDGTPNGFPDNWMIPYNMTETNDDTNGDGIVDDEDDQSFTEIDLDADGVVDISTSCTTADAVITSFTGETLVAHDGASALKLAGDCVVEQTNALTIAVDKTYNVQAMVKMSKDYLDDGSNTPAEFSVGVHFYDIDNELMAVDDVTLYLAADHATVDYEDGGDETDGLSYWYRFQGQFGLGTAVPIPDQGICSNTTFANRVPCETFGGTWTENLAATAAVFIVNHSSNDIYFDAVSLKEVDKYYYLDYTVDGTVEREQQDGTNTCINQDTEEGEITSDGGCVAFRDTTSDTQNYAQDGLDCTTCLLSPNSDSCRYVVDACDTNAVLKVKKDRVCSEWISCVTSSLIENADGTVSSECSEINRCDELDEDGNCSSNLVDGLQKPGEYDEYSSSTDIHYSTANGDNDELSAIRNLTGYSKVGLTWDDVLYCDGGPSDGVRCSSDANCVNTAISCDAGVCSNDSSASCSTVDDCYGEGDTGTCTIPFSTEGYYPYGWMPEVGLSGSSTGEDLIEINDFEQLYCAGTNADTSLPCINNATDPSGAGDPGHCFSTSLKTKVESDPDGELTYADFVYVDESGSNVGTSFEASDPLHATLAFCPNSPNFGTYWPFEGGSAYSYTNAGWQPMGDDSSIFVTQFQDYQNCPAPCADIDLNNVLQVGSDAADEAFAGGASYDLVDNVTADGTYALSFDARYVSDFTGVDEGGTPSTVSICLNHSGIGDAAGDELERKDCFVNGFGEADIVFAIDTSGSMGSEITAVVTAVPDLAEQLSSAGIDTQFALVDMDDNDRTDASATDDRGNHIDLDFTSDVSDFQAAVNAMSAESSTVDPTNAIYEVANNSLFDGESLTYRANAQKFLVVVTDTGDEISNDIGRGSAEDAAIAANLPVFVITSGSYECADGDADDDDPCTNFYDGLTEATGGDTYSYDPTGSTSLDWAADTNIIDDLFESIIDNIDIFQFSTDMETYTLGPIVAEQLAIDEDAGEQGLTTVTTALEFIGSDGNSFQIDNVSLLPVLEVNQDLNPIGRTCRAYPEEDSTQCSYVEQTGTQFQGWKGYCLEVDPLNINRCITWWPMDVLEGETSLVQREASGYSGRSSVYHCLVSKGLEHPGFCDAGDYDSGDSANDYNGDGNAANDWGGAPICTEGATCGSGTCFQGGIYKLDDTNSASRIEEHDDLTDDYEEDSTTSGGQCGVVEDSELDCATWQGGGSCSDTTYTTQEDCEDPSVGGTWSDETDIMNNTAILDTGDCIDIQTTASDGAGNDHYADYDDSEYSSLVADSYCFYDVDGATGAEVRSTRSCSTDTQCQTPDTTNTYSCASLACESGNTSCGYHDSETSSECASVASVTNDNPYEARLLTWDMPDPYETAYQNALADYLDNGLITAVAATCIVSGALSFTPPCLAILITVAIDANNQARWGAAERGVVVRLPANELMRNIHASEIESLEFFTGSAGDGAGGRSEYKAWGQDQDLGYGSGKIWLTDLAQGAIQYDESGNVVTDKNGNETCYSARDGDDIVGFGCYTWGLYDNHDMELDTYTEESFPKSSQHGLDLVYTFVWSNFDWGTQIDDGQCNISCDETGGRCFSDISDDDLEEWSDSGCVDHAVKYLAGAKGIENRNVWYDIESNHSSFWSEFYEDDITNQTADIISFTENDIEESGNNKIWPDPDDQDDDDTLNGRHDGGNILSLYVDFNDEGYIQAVYVLEYYAAIDTEDNPVDFHWAMVETTFEDRMYVDVQTRESCALVAESVSATGDERAWAARTNSVGYEINYGEDVSIPQDEPNEPYGSVSTQDGDPTEWDYIGASAADWTSPDFSWNTLGQQPSVAMTGDTLQIRGGHPMSCIGECESTACVGSPGNAGDSCSSDDDCGDGICMGIGDTVISADGQFSQQATTFSNFDDQVAAVAGEGRDRLKHVFANIDSFYLLNYVSTPYNTVDENGDTISDYWDDGSGNVFDNMEQCTNNERTGDLGSEEEYCGVLPSVTSSTIDDNSALDVGNYEIGNGQSVTFQFTANVDEQQKPLSKIYIDWGDGSEPTTENWEAEPTIHTYAHAYSCSPADGARYCYTSDDCSDVGQFCEFKPKIVLVDNWNWCSGAYDGDCSTGSYATEEECTDNDATWTDVGDHRYTVGATDIMASCQSYDETSLTIRVDASN
ncbi:MAG TPA: hypothetical protein DEG44_06010, partial [Candidatus Kerfeldbacteria bacterium]|nr:hypothetical protein [Candidatus Kerfeldbacteria bacterium]